MRTVSIIFISVILLLSVFGSWTMISQSRNAMVGSCFASLSNLMECAASPGDLGYISFHTNALKNLSQSYNVTGSLLQILLFFFLFSVTASLFVFLRSLPFSKTLALVSNQGPLFVSSLFGQVRWLSRHENSPTR